jgi:hypothetical protein
MKQNSYKNTVYKNKGTGQIPEWGQRHHYSSIFHKIVLGFFLFAFFYAAQAQNKLSIYGGIQSTVPIRKILIQPPGVFNSELKSGGWEGGLKYSHNLNPFLSISAETCYSRYGYLMIYDRTKIDHHYLQSNLLIAFYPFYKIPFKTLQSLYIGGGPGMNYYLGTKSPDPLKYRHDAKFILNSKISAGISLYRFTVSPYWVTFLTHINDIDHGSLHYKEYFKAYGVSLSYDIVRKAKTSPLSITP